MYIFISSQCKIENYETTMSRAVIPKPGELHQIWSSVLEPTEHYETIISRAVIPKPSELH